MKLLHLTPVVLIIIVFLGEPAKAARTLFDLGSLEATQNSESVEGKAFDKKISKHLNSEYSKIMQQCFSVTSDPDDNDFKIVLELSEIGEITDIEARPKTNIAICLMNALENDIFPKPPKSHYWVEIDMGISG